MKPLQPILYYITAHGYGHGVRSCDIVRALMEKAPNCPLRIISDLPVDFLRSRLNLPASAFRCGSFDVGMVQIDSIRVDVPQTLARVEEVLARRPRLIAEEVDFIRETGAGLVVCDIPSIPLEAARVAGVPSMAVGNFAWDWIYEEFEPEDSRWTAAVQAFRKGYAGADLLLRLPFAEPMAAFPRREDIPLVARPGRNRRDDLARRYNVDASKTWALLSFTTLEWDEAALRAIGKLDDVVFFTVLPLGWPGENFCAVDREAFSFSDVIASCDVVVSKPGYGILSECVVNDKPLVYAERENFREYPVLEAAVKKHMRHRHIPAADLYRGALREHIEAALIAPPAREPLASGGDIIAAERMIEFGRR
ncbi:MAG: hypothetical protein ACO398_07300 [Kiritimatiellia bacterium]